MSVEKTVVEIGLPIYLDINKQLRYRPYFNSHMVIWYTPVSRLPAFQFFRQTDASNPIDTTNASAEFVLVNSVTLAETDLLAHFTTAQNVTTYDGTEYYKYNASEALPSDMAEGRYYLRIADGRFVWYSEEFMACSIPNIDEVTPPSGNYMLRNDTEYVLRNATDKVLIN